jgi:hypothetical protein
VPGIKIGSEGNPPAIPGQESIEVIKNPPRSRQGKRDGFSNFMNASYLYPLGQSTLAEAKNRLNIHRLWIHFNYPGQPSANCRCPWREDEKPSFSVNAYGTLFNDFATGEAVDAVDFFQRASRPVERTGLAHCRLSSRWPSRSSSWRADAIGRHGSKRNRPCRLVCR